MIKICSYLGNISISKRYLVKLAASAAEGCFGIAGLHSVSVYQNADDSLDVKLTVTAADDVNIPAVADAVSHKVGYVLTKHDGEGIRSEYDSNDNKISEEACTRTISEAGAA